MRWVAYFSQTGSELYEVSKRLGRFPDKVFYNTNFGTLPPIDVRLLAELNVSGKTIEVLPNQPRESDYSMFLEDGDIVTLHGWLRIIPPNICNKFEIYNGHPGLITDYPELKGKDPQEKAFNLQLKESGCVIHKVTPVVDDGQILLCKAISIENMELDDIIHSLHDVSIDLWEKFLKSKLYKGIENEVND